MSATKPAGVCVCVPVCVCVFRSRTLRICNPKGKGRSIIKTSEDNFKGDLFIATKRRKREGGIHHLACHEETTATPFFLPPSHLMIALADWLLYAAVRARELQICTAAIPLLV